MHYLTGTHTIGFLDFGVTNPAQLLVPGCLLVRSQTYLDCVRVYSYSRNANPAYVFGARMAVEGLTDSISNLFDVGYLKLGVDYAGGVQDDTWQLLLVYLLGGAVGRSWKSIWCYFAALSCNCGP